MVVFFNIHFSGKDLSFILDKIENDISIYRNYTLHLGKLWNIIEDFSIFKTVKNLINIINFYKEPNNYSV